MTSQPPVPGRTPPAPQAARTSRKRIILWIVLAPFAVLGTIIIYGVVFMATVLIGLGSIFGGLNSAPDSLNTGALYDPSSNSWTEMSTENAPSGRYRPYAFWTGEDMLVWGGFYERADFPVNDTIAKGGGGLYNPVTNTWREMSSKGDPGGRRGAAVVWTGSQLFVWGGIGDGGRGTKSRNDGAIYNVATDTWQKITTDGAPSPRFDSVGVWAGDELIVWGGNIAPPLHPDYQDEYVSNGARYDPRTDSWTPLPTAGAPECSRDVSTVWTGDDLVILGGDTGARFNPAVNSWYAMPALLPGMREVDLAVWTGGELLVWGNPIVRFGEVIGSPLQMWASDEDRWEGVIDPGYFTSAAERAGTWGGGSLLVVGPGKPSELDGRIVATFDPAAGKWARLSSQSLPESVMGRTYWTGEDALILGINWGWNYSSTIDRWSELPAEGHPPARAGATALWTGSVFILWGGIEWD